MKLVTMNKEDLLEIENKGYLPWKNFKGNWCVTYLSRHAEGVCDAEFDTIFEALRFAKELGK